MKISKTNMMFLSFFEKDHEGKIPCTTTIPSAQSGALALSHTLGLFPLKGIIGILCTKQITLIKIRSRFVPKWKFS
jgi:hypothetical protein